MSNREFLEQHAGPGRIGLAGGLTLIDKAICRAERHLDDNARWSTWSHAFIFQGRRADGFHWVLESDLDIEKKHIRLGVQENRIDKYFNETLYTNLAILDLQLPEPTLNTLLRESLELVANRTHYSVRELLGTLIALRSPALRSRNNPLEQESSFYCSAFVRHVFHKSGVDLTPGLHAKNTTPEDISRTPVPHLKYLLERETFADRPARLAARIHQRVQKRIAKIKTGKSKAS